MTDEDNFTREDLLGRGWTRAMIRRFLGEGWRHDAANVLAAEVSPQFRELPPSRLRIIDRRAAAATAHALQLDRLERKLLSLGGKEMERTRQAYLVEELIDRGQTFDLSVRTRRGLRNQCHGNSAGIWGRYPDRYRMVFGYGLSDDGVWWQHSWVVDDGGIVETTVARERYFGIVAEPQLARSFFMNFYLPRRYPGAVAQMTRK